MLAAIVGLQLKPDRRAFHWTAGPSFKTVYFAHGATSYGYLTPEMCQARGLDQRLARVFLDGVDVTDLRVLACDDRRGYIEIVARDARGTCHCDAFGRVAHARRYGRVVVTFTPAPMQWPA